LLRPPSLGERRLDDLCGRAVLRERRLLMEEPEIVCADDLPESASSAPVGSPSSVDFPAPFSPTIPSRWPE
jgi:hypothetical protein